MCVCVCVCVWGGVGGGGGGGGGGRGGGPALWRPQAGGEPVAGLPALETRGRFSVQSHSLPGGCPARALQAPGAPQGLDRELIESWASSLDTTALPHRLAITFPDDQIDCRDILQKKGFSLVTQTSYVVSLSGRTFADWEASLRTNMRNQNRQALARGGSFERVRDPQAVKDIQRLAQLTARRHKRPGLPYSEKFYSLLLDPRGPLSGAPELARVYMVRVGGRPAAFELCLVQGQRMWSVDHGADETTFDFRPNNLLYRGLIEQAFREGLDVLDLGAVPEGAASLANFKTGLGGEPYHRLSAVRATPLFRLGAALRAAYHRYI